jgi:peptidoglycan/LPS O-acetylase OafA/YrhL
MTKIEKWSMLAGLRFALASIVAINHLAEYADLGFLALIPRFGAFEAILGFLLISGYSISVSYLKEPEHFIFRRFKRVYPIYIASIVITLVVTFFILHQAAPPWWSLVFNLLFLNQLFTATSFVGPAWSLSLEFWLYCLAPTLIMARPEWNRFLVYISFFCYLLYTACRTIYHLPYYSGVGYGANLLFLSFIWICGLRLAREDSNGKSILRDIALIFTLHLALSAGIQFLSRVKHHSIGMFFSYDLISFSMQFLTLFFVFWIFSYRVTSQDSGRRRSGLLRFLGDISYPLYLIHIPIYAALSRTPLKTASVYYLIALAISAALYWLVDGYSKRRHLKVLLSNAL